MSTWIAVVYDLLAKIRELSLGGDAQAQTITAELANLQPRIELNDMAAIRRILEIERDIVDTANAGFAFFHGQQMVDLRRLRDDRNRCAHPTYQGTDQPYSPTAELARSHLVHAVRHVLSVPPVQGRAATAHIVRLVESNLFPIDPEQAKIQLRAGGLERPKESLVRAVMDNLVFGMFEGTPQIKARPQTAVAIRAVHELFPGLAEPRLRRALNVIGRRAPDQGLEIYFLLQTFLVETWNSLEQDNQNRLTEFLRQAGPVVTLRVLPACLEIPALAVETAAKVQALDHAALGELLKYSKHVVPIARAVDVYCSARSWDQANTFYQHVIEPILHVLQPAQLRRILVAARDEGADLLGAHSFSSFARYVYQAERLPRVEAVATLRGIGGEHLVAWIAQG
ncbi:MAG: hypothetical protein AB7L90_21400 [Hyphomicrobiaceae bacterium]